MPLVGGSSDEAISENIFRLVSEGYSQDQATAIAYEHAGRARGKQRESLIVQSIIVSKEVVDTADDARAKVPEGFDTDDLDETEQSYRFRQRPPGHFKPDSFRIVVPEGFPEGVSSVMGRLKEGQKTMKRFGGASVEIKSLDDGYLQGYLVRFTSPQDRDLEGEYFDRHTNFMRSAGFPIIGAPVLYEHGISGFGAIGIGAFDFVNEDDVGLFVRAKLHARKDYEKMLQELNFRKRLGLTSEKIAQKASLAHSAVMEALRNVPHNWSMGSYPPTFKTGEGGHIAQCGIVEGSITVAPAEPDGTDVLGAYRKSLVNAFTVSDAVAEAAIEPGDTLTGESASNWTWTVVPDGVPSGTTYPYRKSTDGGKQMDMQAFRDLLMQAIAMLDQGMMEEVAEEKQTKPEEIEEEVAKAAEEMIAADEEAQKQLDEAEKKPESEKAVAKFLSQWLEDNAGEIFARGVARIEKRRAGFNSAFRKAVSDQVPMSKRERVGAYGNDDDVDRGAGQREATCKSFKHVNVNDGFARRVDRTPLLMHLKAWMMGVRGDEDVHRYIKHYQEEVKAWQKAGSAFIGASLDYLGTPAIREELIRLLREKTFLDKVGARFYTVDGNQTVERPRLTSVPTGEWLGEGNSFTDQENAAEMLIATPKPVGARYALSLALFDRMKAADEAMLRDELTLSIARALNRAALRGVGNVVTSGGTGAATSTGAEPLGLLNALPAAQKAVLSTNGRAPTPADMKAMKAAVEARNVELGDATHWVYHSNVLNYFEDLTDTTGQLLNRSQWTKGYEPITTNLVLTNLTEGTGTNLTRIYFGDWSFFEVVQNSDIRMVLLQGDTYMGKLQVAVQAWTYVDFLIHQTAAFEIKQAVKV